MTIKKPIVENWINFDNFYFSEIKDDDLLSAQNIALSSDPINTLKIEQENLLCLPSCFILGSGSIEDDLFPRRAPFTAYFPCYKSISLDQLESIFNQYQIFVRFNSYLACEKTEYLPQNVTHCLYEPNGFAVEPSSLLHLKKGLNMKPASYQKKRNIKAIEKFFSIVKRSDNEEVEYSIFSVNNEIYPLRSKGDSLYGLCVAPLSVEHRLSCPTPFKHFYEYELFAVKKS